MEGNLGFDYSGPWAPHNFIELKIAELGSIPSPQESPRRLHRGL